MSRLEEIRERLYRRKSIEPAPSGEDVSSRPRSPELEAGAKRHWDTPALDSPTLLEQTYLARFRQRRIALRFAAVTGALVLVGLVAFIGYTIFFAPAEVTFAILGPSQTSAGEITTFTIRIVNGSGIALHNGAITFTFPPGTLPVDGADSPLGQPVRHRWDVEDIPAGGIFQREIRVKLLGPVGETQTINSLFFYRPENIQGKLTRSAEFSTTIVRVPVVVSIDLPERLSAGTEFPVTITVDSEASAPFPGVWLGVDFPDGFELLSVNPPFATGTENIWAVGILEPGTSQRIVLQGKVQGEPEEVKAVRIRLGRYDAVTKTWLVLTERTAVPTIASPFLLARTTLSGSRQGSIAPGSRVDGLVFFKNNLAQKIRNVSLVVTFPEKFVTLQSVQAENGFYDVTRQALIWNPASHDALRELAPGQEGTVAFSFAVKSALPIRSFSDKNFLFPVKTIIDTADPLPEHRGVSFAYQDAVNFKIESHLRLAARVSYYDSPVPNSGPLPPRVRQTTTYTLFLQLTSGANDLRDVEVRGELGGGVEWVGGIATDIGMLQFNPASREVVWRIQELAAATGILRPHVTALIQVALTPAENQVSTAPFLARSISTNGTDAFTNTTPSDSVGDLTTELRSDPKSNSNEWRVVP